MTKKTISKSFYLRNSEVRANAISYISQIDDSDVVVTVKSAQETRSAAQSRLRWLWMSQLEKELAGVGRGRNREDWNLAFKHKFMASILIEQDEDYDNIFFIYRSTCNALDGEGLKLYQRQFWDRVISTKDMNVKSMSQWLNQIEIYVSEKYNIILKVPDDLTWIRN